MLKFFANHIWINIPNRAQKRVSQLLSQFFELKISRVIIIPYCLFFGLDGEYLNQFESETEQRSYSSYSDFFQRKLRYPLNITSSMIWPCEGYICDWGPFVARNSVIKGQRIDLNSIFKASLVGNKEYHFVNIFLHNHNYHRIHAPTDGTIKRISRLPGDLIFLRPWFYEREKVSYPSLRNERVLVEIEDRANKIWHLAIVGGFGVGTIEMGHEIEIGSKVSTGQEIGKFKLGSTVCMAIPYQVKIGDYLQIVRVGQNILTS